MCKLTEQPLLGQLHPLLLASFKHCQEIQIYRGIQDSGKLVLAFVQCPCILILFIVAAVFTVSAAYAAVDFKVPGFQHQHATQHRLAGGGESVGGGVRGREEGALRMAQERGGESVGEEVRGRAEGALRMARERGGEEVQGREEGALRIAREGRRECRRGSARKRGESAQDGAREGRREHWRGSVFLSLLLRVPSL
eukprot:3516529-Rhodomonas_salina.1